MTQPTKLRCKILEFKSGSLYRARDGGYLVHLEYVVVVKPQSWTITMSDDYSTTEPSQVTYLYDRTYAPDGTLDVEVPEVCVGQVKVGCHKSLRFDNYQNF